METLMICTKSLLSTITHIHMNNQGSMLTVKLSLHQQPPDNIFKRQRTIQLGLKMSEQ